MGHNIRPVRVLPDDDIPDVVTRLHGNHDLPAIQDDHRLLMPNGEELLQARKA